MCTEKQRCIETMQNMFPGSHCACTSINMHICEISTFVTLVVISYLTYMMGQLGSNYTRKISVIFTKLRD